MLKKVIINTMLEVQLGSGNSIETYNVLELLYPYKRLKYSNRTVTKQNKAE